MADAVDLNPTTAPAPTGYAQAPAALPADDSRIVFRGTPRNMAVGWTLMLAGGIAFTMGMTDVFFARAMAWTFVIWGALFLLNDLRDWYRSWVVSDDGLRIGYRLPFTRGPALWDWDHISRLDLLVKRIDPKIEDVVMQVYFTPEGDSVLLREDRVYSPELADLIIRRARLKATHANNPSSFDEMRGAKATYVWNKSGKFVNAM